MEHLSFEKINEVGILRINRPQVLNALNSAVLEEMRVFLEITAREQKLKAVILTGTGNKAFIAGADIREMQGFDQKQMQLFCKLGQNVANILETAPYLTIAAVNGYALGGGLEMALACDFIYASQHANFGLPEVSLGLIPGFGGNQRLTRAAGTRVAKELIMSGRSFTADKAKEIGVINQICEPDALLQQSLDTAAEIIKNSFTAIIQAKRVINYSIEMSTTEAEELERNVCAACFDTNERRIAMKTFLNNRKG